MQTYFEGDQVSLFDQDTSAGKTCLMYLRKDVTMTTSNYIYGGHYV